MEREQIRRESEVDVGSVQRDLLRVIPVKDIASGTGFPYSSILENLSPKFCLLDVGCGRGEKTIAIAREVSEKEVEGNIIGVDINLGAVNLLAQRSKKEGLSIGASCMDVLNLAFSSETFDAITAFGLFCNLIDSDAEKGAEELARVLKPGGRAYLADCLRLDGFVLSNLGAEQEALVLAQEKWQKRYQENEKLGLPFGTFLVFQMGHKHREYDSVEQLKAHWNNSAVFERFARHWEKEELIGLFEANGLSLELSERDVFHSRTGEALLGINAILIKE